MKNIFIGGVARSYKSVFINKLKEHFNYNHIPFDYFVSSLKDSFFDVDINTNVVMNEESSKKIAMYLDRVCSIMECSNEKFIIDSAQILPSDIVKYLDRDKWDIYYFGYPDLTAKAKLKQMSRYNTDKDWTYNKSDKELLEVLNKLVLSSRRIQKDCRNIGITFVDTSNDYEKTINSIIRSIN